MECRRPGRFGWCARLKAMGISPALWVWQADDGGVGDAVIRRQVSPQLCPGDLEP